MRPTFTTYCHKLRVRAITFNEPSAEARVAGAPLAGGDAASVPARRHEGKTWGDQGVTLGKSG